MGTLRPVAAIAALLLFLACAPAARAEMLANDNVPAATLLFPHFEVDLDDADGVSTLLTWRNASASAMLTHVTVYTDLGIPVLTFNTYLTGYDVVTLDLRAMLVDGVLPETASAGQDPQDLISPQGIFSQDINFASCYGQMPHVNPVLFPSTTDDLRRQLTGQSSTFSGQCSGFDHGDNIARGYVTLDTVNNCTTRRPNDPGYFGPGGGGDVTNQNTLAGEYVLFGPGERLVHTGAAVPIEASDTAPETSVPGEYTFYGRHVAYTAMDNREPLAATWAIDAQARGSEFIVWRDTKVMPSPFNCNLNGPASFYPIGQESVIQFDRQAQAQPLAINATPFPLASQRVVLVSSALPAGLKPGWTYLGLNTAVPGAPGNPPEDPSAMQAYVTVVQFPERPGVGGSSGAAVPLDSAGDAAHVHPIEITP